MTAVALTIAGSDPSGGAGLQADLKTFHQHGVYGMSVVTLLTVQNTHSVSQIEVLKPIFVLDQLSAVIEDIPPAAAKTGALGNAAVIEAVAEQATDFAFPLVVDPVMISKHGTPLMEESAVQVAIELLLPSAFLITPNLHEAEALTGTTVTNLAEMEVAARRIAETGPQHVLIKGGHLEGEPLDLLWSDGRFHRFPNKRIDTPHTHGTGCVFSAAITARLALGETIVDAVAGAKKFITRAIETNPGLGRGYGPTNMLSEVDSERGA